MQRVRTPMQHHVTSLCKLAFKAVPRAIHIGAPTDIVPIKPNPIMPYFSQRRCSIGCFFSSFFVARFLKRIFLILSLRKAVKNTPTRPPETLAKKITHGDSFIAKPVGIATYISKVAKAATVSIFNIINA